MDNKSSFISHWIILCSSLLVIFLFISANLYQEHSSTQQIEHDRLMTQARAVKENLTMQLQSTNRALDSVINDLPFWWDGEQYDPGTILRLKTVNDIIEGINTIEIFDNRGFLRVSSREKIIDGDFSNEDYFRLPKQRPSADVLFLSTPFKTDLNVWGMNLSKVITDKKGNFSGVVSATLDHRYFKTLLSSLQYAPDMWSAVAHGSGKQFIMIPEREGQAGKDLAQPGSLFSRHRESGRQVSLLSGNAFATGENRFILIVTVNPEELHMDQPLVVAISRDVDAVFANWWKGLKTQFGIFLLLTLLSTLSLKHYHNKIGRSEEELNKHKVLLTSILDGTTDSVYAKDLKGRYTIFNTAASKVTGKEINDVIGKDDTYLFPIDEAKAVMDGDRMVMDAGKTVTYEEQVTNASGKKATYLSTKGPLYGLDGKVAGLFGIARDITERKRMEEVLQNSEYFFKESQRAASIGSYHTDFITGFWESSEVLDRIFGIDRDYSRTVQGWLDIIHPDDRAMMDRYLREEVIQKHKPFSKEYRIVRVDDGEVRWVFGMGKVDFDARGNIITMIGTIHDITERKQSEMALLHAEKKFRGLLENVHLVSVMLDINGNITFCNDYFLDLTGWQRDEVLNKNWFELFLPEEVREAVRSMFRTGISEGTLPLHYENPIITHEGSLKLIVWDNSLLRDIDEKVIGVASIGTDVTGHRKLEEQLRHAQKMEAIGTLAGGIAHDFNNILNVILGYGTMVQDSLKDDSPSREQMKEVLTAADRAADLTRRLLLFSRKEVAEWKLTAVNSIVINMEKMLSRIIREDIRLVTDLMDNNAMIMVDVGQIEQVLMNLASNARDAMPEGGSLTIKTELMEIDTEFINAYGYGKPGTFAVISITDTGTGIDKEKQTMIFDPFFSTKEVGKGTGLGLSMAYGIIKQHNGYIKVYSETGKGTTFKIWLPVSKGTSDNKPEVEALTSMKGGTETILVAEDDVSLLKLTKTILGAFGYNVITAEDGEDAVAKFLENREKINLIILDMTMPKKSGKDAYEEIRKTSPGMKTLFVSGYTMDTIKAQDITNSGFDFLYKPVVPKELLKKVREILDRGSNEY